MQDDSIQYQSLTNDTPMYQNKYPTAQNKIKHIEEGDVSVSYSGQGTQNGKLWSQLRMMI